MFIIRLDFLFVYLQRFNIFIFLLTVSLSKSLLKCFVNVHLRLQDSILFYVEI